MRLTPSVTEFLGYDNQGQTNRTLVYINGVREWVPIPLPSWTSRNTSTSAVVQDGQTLVLGSLPGTDLRRNGKPGDKRMLVFITPTIIDAAGNRVNTR
jgi:type II secretory pathway component GspD/PulD (secretin)